MIFPEKNRWRYPVPAWTAVVFLVLLLPSSNDLGGGVVEAFQPPNIRFHPPSNNDNFQSSSSVVVTSPNGPAVCTKLPSIIIDSNIVVLGMTAADSDESTDGSSASTQSKRTRFKESIKKIIFYPKNKIQRGLRKIRRNRGASTNVQHQTTNDILIEGGAIRANGEHNKKVKGDSLASFIRKSSLAWEGEVNGNVVEPTTKTLTAPQMTLEPEQDATSVITATESENDSKDDDGDETDGTTTTTTTIAKSSESEGRRSATTETVDLSGKWELVVSDDFKASYDKYLKLLGQPSLVRSVALSIIGMTTEETYQSDHGRELKIRGRNVRGNWERTLKASCADDPLVVPIVTADNETVQSECWWEGPDSTIHRSWLRGVERYGGGNFESKRYLEQDGKALVCESTFHPIDPNREKASVVWKFRRVDDHDDDDDDDNNNNNNNNNNH